MRRWEKQEGLPVHRHLHHRRDSIYAYTTELDIWQRGRQNHLPENGALDAMMPAGEDGSIASARSQTRRRNLGLIAVAALSVLAITASAIKLRVTPAVPRLTTPLSVSHFHYRNS